MSGYSKTPLIRKLGIKEGMRLRFIEAPEDYFSWLGPLPDVQFPRRAPYDFVHIFVNSVGLLENELLKFRGMIADDGMIWVSWYKKTSGMNSEITEDTIRDTAIALGLVDVKVCAVSEKWSGLKLVIRVENRKNRRH